MKRGRRWVLTGLAGLLLGFAGLGLLTARREDEEDRLRRFIGDRVPVATVDYPSTTPADSIFVTAYSWRGEAAEVQAKADILFRPENGWRRRRDSSGLSPAIVYTWNRPRPPAWLTWLLRRPTPSASYVAVTISPNRASWVSSNTSYVVSPLDEPWTTLQIEDVGAFRPPRPFPSSLPSGGLLLRPTPRRKGERASFPIQATP